MEEILLEHEKRYPRMQASDYYKLMYQQTFGNGHYQLDEMKSLNRLEDEYHSLEKVKNQQLYEPIGNGFVRVYLTSPELKVEQLPLLNKLFIHQTNDNEETNAHFEERLGEVVRLAEENILKVDAELLKAAFLSYKSKGYPATSHSEVYRENYAPHYRVLHKHAIDYLLVIEKVIRLEQKETPQLIAIDGRCGSGKTTMASFIASVVDCNVFHMDDFFLPKEMKTKERLNEPGGNVHYERVLEEVIEPITKQEDVNLVPFNCSINDLDQLTNVPFKKINVIEGVYALHPRLVGYYNYKVFMTVDENSQLDRIKARGQGAMLHRFVEEWIPLEEKYFHTFDVKNIADIILRT